MGMLISTERIRSIDGLRAVAVGIVILSHTTKWVPGGGVGVDIFFVISGLVITRSLSASSCGEGWRRAFYIKRVWRLWPALWTMVGAVLLISELMRQPQRLDVLGALTSSMNWLRAAHLTTGGWLGHTWSLAIEEQFYLVWPLIFPIVRIRARATVSMLVALAALVTWRTMLVMHGASVERVYNGLDTHADGLVLGCALGLNMWRPRGWMLQGWFIPLAGLLFLACYPLPVVSNVLIAFYFITAALSAWLISTLLGGPTAFQRLLDHPFLQWGGSRSYSLYLWHFPIIQLVERIAGSGGVSRSFAVLASAVAAEASFRLIEKPVQSWSRGTWFGRRGPEVGLASTGIASGS
jgi:peptidoglycan/LPS O-acetylase OafA/YrhL